MSIRNTNSLLFICESEDFRNTWLIVAHNDIGLPNYMYVYGYTIHLSCLQLLMVIHKIKINVSVTIVVSINGVLLHIPYHRYIIINVIRRLYHLTLFVNWFSINKISSVTNFGYQLSLPNGCQSWGVHCFNETSNCRNVHSPRMVCISIEENMLCYHIHTPQVTHSQHTTQ